MAARKKPERPDSLVRPFARYRATRRIRSSLVVGGGELVIEEGETILTDGVSVRLPDGRTVSSPSVQAVVELGWLVPD